MAEDLNSIRTKYCLLTELRDYLQYVESVVMTAS
jgi:hypothetical protein